MSNFNTTNIRLTSRASIKIGESFYTFESCVEKQCAPEIANEVTTEEIKEVKQQLWDEVNADVDNQIEETLKFLKKNR